MSTSREEQSALNEAIRSFFRAYSKGSIPRAGSQTELGERLIRHLATNPDVCLAATPKAGVDREVIARTLEGIILRRMHEKRIEGYTLEMSRELADALPSVLGGVDQPRFADGQQCNEQKPQGLSLLLLEALTNIRDCWNSYAPIDTEATQHYVNTMQQMHDLADEALSRADDLAEMDAVAPDNAGLVSGGGR